MKSVFNAVVSLALLLPLAGCSSRYDEAATLTLATTTSTRDSGLLDVLVPMFEEQTGIDVKVVAVGSGQALELGRRGDADVLLTHAPHAEARFVAEGYGRERHAVMENDFVLLGPPANPAHARNEMPIAATFGQIASSHAPFVSRGDESGTHMKEMAVWQGAEIEPQGPWYVQAGAGMAEALRIANEKRAYTLSDRATFLSNRDRLDLTILSEGDPLLRNPYAVIVVNSKNYPDTHRVAADRFVEFLLSPNVQRVIAQFGTQRYGQPLFFPTASNHFTS